MYAEHAPPALGECLPVAKRLRARGVALRDARFPAIDVAELLLRRLYPHGRRPVSAIAAELATAVDPGSAEAIREAIAASTVATAGRPL